MPETQTTIDPDTAQLMRNLEQGLKEAQAGVYAQAHSPDDIARRKRGRPAGSVKAVPKEPVKLRLDADVLAALRATGHGRRLANPHQRLSACFASTEWAAWVNGLDSGLAHSTQNGLWN